MSETIFKELILQVEKASKELKDLEDAKKYLGDEIKHLMLERDKIKIKFDEFKLLSQEEAKKMKLAQEKFEKSLEEKNKEFNTLVSACDLEKNSLAKQKEDLNNQEQRIKDLKTKLDSIVDEYRQTTLAKSEKFKKLLEELKK